MTHIPGKLQDGYDRRLTYLRVSITDRCNLRCVYCMPREGIKKVPHADVLSYEELLRVCRIAAGLGISKIRVTGGEPLLRADVEEFLTGLGDVPGLSEVTLTTNGLLLGSYVDSIKAAGIRRVNISLDTIKRDKYRFITGYDFMPRVLGALDEALRAGFDPVKINAVVMRGVNDDEVTELARLSIDRPFHVRFIEYMPMGGSPGGFSSFFVPSAEVKSLVESAFGPLVRVPAEDGDGPARRYRIERAAGEVGFIGAVSDHFCGNCNRLRLTATGALRACLLSDMETDLKGPLRRGAADSEIAEIFRKGALLKPRDHSIRARASSLVNGPMSSIGG